MARKSKVLSKSKAPKDFSKVKNKVGKKKQEKANEMKTDFKVKKVQMPSQNALEEKGEEVTHRKLGLGELLAQLQHHSGRVRRDALRGLLELCRDHPGVLNVNLSQILDSISLAASDGSADVRSAQRSLQAFILDQMPPAALSAFGATLALQVRGAISHVSGEVREDGLKLLELYLSRLGSKQVLTQGEAGRLVSTLCQLHSHVDLVLPCLLQLLSTQTAADEEMGERSQLSLQDVLEGKLKKVTSVSRDSEADNEIWDFCLRAWMQAGDMPRGDAKGTGSKAGWMRLRVAAVLEQALIEVLAGSGDSRPSASQVATLSGIVRRQEWPIHVDAGSPLRPLADSINLRMARMLALLVTGGASVETAPKHLQRLAHASLAVLDTVLLPAVATLAAHLRPLGAAAAAAAAAQALEVVAKGSDEATEVKPFTSVGGLCHGLLVLELLWSTEHFSTPDLQHLAKVTAAVAAGTGRSDDEFLPSAAAILAVPLTASLLDLHCDLVPPLLQRAVPRCSLRRTSRDTARVIEELRPGTLMSWVTSWPKLLWYLGSSHPKLSFFLMATILKLGKAAEAGSLHEKLLSGLLPLLVPFIAGMPGDESPPPLAKLREEDGLQSMAAAMLFHFPRLRVSLIKLLGTALCRWSVANGGDRAEGLGESCGELILEAMLSRQSSESDEEVLITRLRASLAVLQSSPATEAAERSLLKLAKVIAAWVVEQLGATYPATTSGPVTGLRLDQRRHLALQHVAWPLCREVLGAKSSSSARRAFCFFYLCARRLAGTKDDAEHGTDDLTGRVAFLREVFDTLVLSDALQPSPVFQSLLPEARDAREACEARAGARLFVEAWMASDPSRSVAYELLLRLCVESLEGESVAWVLVEAVMYRNAHGLNTDSWGRHPLGFDDSPKLALRQRLQASMASMASMAGAAREQILALLPLL